MGRIVRRILAPALALGAPGLFVVALLDSSFLSFPELADVLVILLVVGHKDRLILYASTATLGSLLGCLALFYVGLLGGDALVRKRFASSTVDRTLAAFRRHGVMAVLIPSLLPPPAPFKIFVLLAGAARIRATQFALAIAIGRGARYFGEGLLAIWYGDRAITYIRENGRLVSLEAVSLLVAGLVAYILWGKARAAWRR
jgi:membrane protein YqaA with SNARE-associated domain